MFFRTKGCMKFYHVSKLFLGEVTTLFPKIPGSSSISIEGDIPRVCFSTHIKYCIRSITGSRKLTTADLTEFSEKHISCLNFEDDETYLKETSKIRILNPSVYAVDSDNVKLYVPPAASDFRSNKEHWAITAVEVKYVGKLCLASFSEEKIKITDQEFTLSKNTAHIHENKILRITKIR